MAQVKKIMWANVASTGQNDDQGNPFGIIQICKNVAWYSSVELDAITAAQRCSKLKSWLACVPEAILPRPVDEYRLIRV